MSARAGSIAKVTPNISISNVTTPPIFHSPQSWDYRHNGGVQFEQFLSRQSRSRGMATMYVDGLVRVADDVTRGQMRPFAKVKLPEVRAALDAITLEDAEEAEFKLYGWTGMPDYSVNFDPRMSHLRVAHSYRGLSTMKVALSDNGRVIITAPCGEKRRISLKNIDRALLALGY